MSHSVRDLFDLQHRVAIVTGGAGLLGAEFSRTMVEAGASVIVADINRSAAIETAESIQVPGGRSLPFMVDVTSPASIDQLVAYTLQAYGRLDILVNCAVLDPKFDPDHSGNNQDKNLSGAFEEFPLDAWNQAISVNLTGAFLCCQAAIRPLLNQGGGVIVNLSSIYGLAGPDQRLYQRQGQPDQFKPVYYSVTKFGILGLTRYLATYYAGKNIRVNALSPGGVYHGHDEAFVMSYSARTILGRMAEKDEMNGALLFLVSDASKYMTGANLVVDGGWTAW